MEKLKSRTEYFRTKVSGIAVMVLAAVVLIWQLVDALFFRRVFSFFDIFTSMFMLLTFMIGGVILFTSYQKEYLIELGSWLDDIGEQIRRTSWPIERDMLEHIGNRLVEQYSQGTEWIMYALLPGYMLRDRPREMRRGRFIRVFSQPTVEKVEEVDNTLRDLLTEQALSSTGRGFEIKETKTGKIAIFVAGTKGLGLSLAIDIPRESIWKGGNWRKQQKLVFIRKAVDQLSQRLVLLQNEWNEFQKTINDEELGMIVRMLSHEIAGNLTLVLGSDKLIEREEKALARTVHLVHQLQEVPSLRTGFFSVEPGEIQLKQMVNEVIGGVKDVWKDREFIIKGSITNNTKVVGDRNLYSILQNLVYNALSFSKEKIIIEMEPGIRKDHVLLKVKDDGPGVPYEKREWIFEPMVAEGTDYRPRGEGVGLYIARRIAREVSGDVYLAEPENGEERSNQFVVQLLVSNPD